LTARLKGANQMNQGIKFIGEAAVLLASAGFWYAAAHQPAPVNAWQAAKPAEQVANLPTQPIKPPSVIVYTPKAKGKLDLPAEIQNDPDKYVLASTKLPNDTHPATVTTVIDQKTGKAETYVRHDPLPWLAFENSGEARIDYGIKSITGTVVRLSVREDVMQVKALHFGANATLDSDGELFAGVGVGFRW
jgi:hypothetical protein